MLLNCISDVLEALIKRLTFFSEKDWDKYWKLSTADEIEQAGG